MKLRDSRNTRSGIGFGSGSIWIRTLVATAALSNLAFDRNVASATEPVDPIRAPESKYALKDLDGHFPFAVPESKEAWESRAKDLRQQLLVSLGMYPMPTLAPVISATRPQGVGSKGGGGGVWVMV